MLKEIKCDLFFESPIGFDKGLNVVLGDNISTNSIGKSIFLLIIDFTFGGSSYTESDAVRELDHHTIFYSIEFNSKNFYFGRNTETSDIIYQCNYKYEILSEIKIGDYTIWLKNNFSLSDDLSFRSMANTYSRIWGKNNYDVNKPLHNYYKDKDRIGVNTLVKLFNFYSHIREIDKELSGLRESKTILLGMYKKDFVHKITKSKYDRNKLELERIETDIENIRNNILRLTLNIEELSNKEVLKLKIQKESLLKEQSLVKNKIERLNLNLTKRSTKKAYFNKLSEYFDNINQAKIAEIENFHQKISSILKKEILSSLEELTFRNEELFENTKLIDNKIDLLLGNIDSPRYIIDNVYDLTIQKNKLEIENNAYEKGNTITSEIKDKTESLDNTMSSILQKIEKIINDKLVDINNEIYLDKKKNPQLFLKTNSYTYDHSSNTGTGKTYVNLIEFDLAVFSTTQLPYIIHDSLLFKNIEDSAMNSIIEIYNSFEKQIFIAIDGINKYDNNTQALLNSNSVLNLSKTKRLFNRDWS